MKINIQDLEKRSKKYWNRVRSTGISRQRGESQGIIPYLMRILEKKSILTPETKREVYRVLGESYVQIDHRTEAWRYLMLANGPKQAKQTMQKWKERWSETYKRISYENN